MGEGRALILFWRLCLDPDNYTDPPTFLSHLQRNPRRLPYDFWPLVADSTVIVQHVCSVAIFICCFVGIIQERVSPVSVVGWASTCTVLGWLLWDFWVGQEDAARVAHESLQFHGGGAGDESAGVSVEGGESAGASWHSNAGVAHGLGLMLAAGTAASVSQPRSRTLSATSFQTTSSPASPVAAPHLAGSAWFSAHGSAYPPAYGYGYGYGHGYGYGYPASKSSFSPRNQQRLATAKSAILIYCALLGLSPILKSLTKSTTSDSIWAISWLLMCINVFFFDYGGGVGVQ